jgi:hypothetical protein
MMCFPVIEINCQLKKASKEMPDVIQMSGKIEALPPELQKL